ncbi:MAG: DUF1292 domain-containing protein [Ruminococcus sp.]|nr:DUF1292 domain-containing protein [Ruminococcus sp.]
MSDRNCKEHNNSTNDTGLGTVTLLLDNDESVLCQILCFLPVDNKEYIALLPVDEINNEESSVYLYQVLDADSENPQLVNIEDDDEYEAVADAYDEWLDTLEYETLDLDALGLDALE